MANSYKYLSERDRVVATNNLYTSCQFNKGGSWTSQDNTVNSNYTKYFTGSVQTGYNIFDISYGRSSATTTTGDSTILAKEKNIYNEFSKVLIGTDVNNAPKVFNLANGSPDKDLHNAYFINFNRNYFKDRIGQGNFNANITVSGTATITLKDVDVNNSASIYTCPIGNYGILYASSSSPGVVITAGTNDAQGLLFYEAGIAVVSPYVFAKSGSIAPTSDNQYIHSNSSGILTGDVPNYSGSVSLQNVLTGSSILNNNSALSSKISSISFDAISELNSTIYFCRAYNHEFNYSTNPTFVNNGEIVVKNGDPDKQPRTYITTVGLYSDDNQLLAVAKLSEPILKTPENELIARVRLDF